MWNVCGTFLERLLLYYFDITGTIEDLLRIRKKSSFLYGLNLLQTLPCSSAIIAGLSTVPFLSLSLFSLCGAGISCLCKRTGIGEASQFRRKAYLSIRVKFFYCFLVHVHAFQAQTISFIHNIMGLERRHTGGGGGEKEGKKTPETAFLNFKESIPRNQFRLPVTLRAGKTTLFLRSS